MGRPAAFLAAILLVLAVVYRPADEVFNSTGDVTLYRMYARLALESPMVLPHEYPPLAAGLFVVPELASPGRYILGFALFTALAVWLTVLIVDRLSRDGWWLLLYLALGSWGVLFFRFDIFVVLLTVLAFAAAARQRWLAAQAFLALGVALKLYPLILMPLVVIWQWRVERRLPFRSALGGALLLLALGGGTWLLAPAETAAMLRYHRERPLEFESVGAGVAWMLGSTTTQEAFGSTNVVSPISRGLIPLLAGASALLLLVVYGYFLRGRLEPALAWALALLLVIATSKVFSTQYILWALPFVALARTTSDGTAPGAQPPGYRWLWITICLLTGLIFPFALTRLGIAQVMSLVVLRNTLWLAACWRLIVEPGTLGRWSRALEPAKQELQYWRRNRLWPGAILLALIAANALSLRWHTGKNHRLDIGFWSDEEVVSLKNFSTRETTPSGTTYRWTEGQSELRMSFVSMGRPLLTMAVGGVPAPAEAPRPVSTQVDGAQGITLPIAAAPRQYQFMLPAASATDGGLDLSLRMPTSRVPSDERELGIRLDDVSLAWLPGSWVMPAWQTLLAQWSIVIASIAAARRLGLPRVLIVGIAGGLILGLCWMSGYDLFAAAIWQRRMMVASLILLALTLGMFPLPARRTRPERFWTGSVLATPDGLEPPTLSSED